LGRARSRGQPDAARRGTPDGETGRAIVLTGVP